MTTPKERFMASGHVEAWKKTVETMPFLVACDYALLQLASEAPPTTVPGRPCDPYAAIDSNSQLYGARRLINILKSLPEPIKPPTPLVPSKLHH